MNTVLVTSPVLQHAHQMALALHERALLQGFWSGVPVIETGEAPPRWMPARWRQRIRTIDIPRALRRHPARFQATTRLARALRLADSDNMHRIFHWFDAWAARQVMRDRPQVVVAYENAAFHTFRAAKAVGARCVLDAAALHHQAALELLGGFDTPYTPEINRRKDEEVRLADMILACSPLAAESYVANGVPSDKLHPLLLGAEPPRNTPEWQPSEGPLRFVFAGVLCLRKSIDLILAAFRRLHAEGLRYELEFIGGVEDPVWIAEVAATPNARYRTNVPQKELYAALAQADCLLLPSRSDSFGMVVAEAMACGTPAIVTTQTGAKAMIENHPGSGWIVEPDADDLHDTLRGLIENPERVRAARPAARSAGQAFSWADYRERAGRLLEDFVR
ncbi:glycosyltransferase family 4 protein [Variovorax sp. J22P168]|uniref:glycosyltransferase family 4 protein n=1 Tax=Variovorax jilinensis TaxID=3053513 RepID=UPI002577FC8C|nr:glycosyltransferase family 4 protein [Variovorax sp. J22P168]MDM0012626.1 glycosyltransferase family 4 protein [Variovorax sp. J22P168]